MVVRRARYSQPELFGRYFGRVCNRSSIPTPLLKACMRFAWSQLRGRPYQVSLLVTDYKHDHWSWRAYTKMFPPDECPSSLDCDGHILLSIAREGDFPVRRRASGGYLDVSVCDRMTALVYLLAHEGRHIYQGTGYLSNCRDERARARRDEADADKYAKRILRKWRREVVNAPHH